MCGIAGIYRSSLEPIEDLSHRLRVMSKKLHHRGPDGNGIWSSSNIGFAHQRLSIIDLETGKQPMSNEAGLTITYNGEIYNYKELRQELKSSYRFRTTSDTEVILAAFEKWGVDCVNKLRGMFSFAIWDDNNQRLFCARDHFGIKPFYYHLNGDLFYFASEIKALTPFLSNIEINKNALRDYLTLQLYLGGKTLFNNIVELEPSHYIIFENGKMQTKRYWQVFYKPDFHHTRKYFEEKLRAAVTESVSLHTRSDVPIGAYVSGGIDSSIVASYAKQSTSNLMGVVGKFGNNTPYDESQYSRALCKKASIDLHEVEITSDDFIKNIEDVIYHLDYPVAGPGSFAQYMVSKYAATQRKVMLGGQGGDEIFGGYARYLVAYFEQCIKGAIDGTLNNGNFIVTYESIIPNLVTLKQYKPMLKQFFSKGLFDPIDHRYFQLINRAPDLHAEINWSVFNNDYEIFHEFKKIFDGDNVGSESYFDKMTHFDFKTLLPALLQVEDRMSMAHGLESRVPLLDKEIVELAAIMPADIKFLDGNLKRILTESCRDALPNEILNRKDKMGFPVPFNDWLGNELKDLIHDTFNSQNAKSRDYINTDIIIKNLEENSAYGRKIWGLFSLELWNKRFLDEHQSYEQLSNEI
jgi:asparagine synthase (glutamine-hydrolysing)